MTYRYSDKEKMLKEVYDLAMKIRLDLNFSKNKIHDQQDRRAYLSLEDSEIKKTNKKLQEVKVTMNSK